MAWKLRKDKLQEETPQDETSTTEGAAAEGATAEEPIALPSFEDHPGPLHSFTTTGAESHEPEADGLRTAAEEPEFAPFDFSMNAFKTDPDPVAETHEGAEGNLAFHSPPPTPEPLAMAGPLNAEEDAPLPSPPGPFQPQEPQSPAEPFAPPPLMPIMEAEAPSAPRGATREPAFEPSIFASPPAFAPEPRSQGPTEEPTAEREAMAAGLILQENVPGVPRVAPFIVDVPPPHDSGRVGATLVLHIGNLSASLPITKDVTVIGRPDSAIQSYPDLEIELDDAVSRRHAEVRRREDGYYLVDTMSTNGTRLNGQPLEANTEHPLAPGDRIHLGDRTEIIFE